MDGGPLSDAISNNFYASQWENIMFYRKKADKVMGQFLAPINRRFGTYRGLIRLGLAHAEHTSGRLRPFIRHDLGHVNRLVFVCQGNICRSSFADHLARSLGIPSVSFGLATTTGMRADPTAMRTS